MSRSCAWSVTLRRGRWLDGRSERQRRQGRRQGVEETAEKAKWCLCGVRKPRVVCLAIGWRSRGGLRATDRRDLQGFAPSSVCQPRRTLLFLPAALPILLPACYATCLITGYKRTPTSLPRLYCKRLPKEMVYKATSIPPPPA